MKRTIIGKIVNKLRYLHMLDWMPDKIYLKIMFPILMDQKLDLKKPKTFNEKLQWLKLYDRHPEYTMMVDKCGAKRYVSEKIGNEYIIPNIGKEMGWKNFKDIDFDMLPNQFVLKCTHDSGGLIICKDKEKFNKNQARLKIERCMEQKYYYQWREWPYKNVERRIIAEPLMDDSNNPDSLNKDGLTDYKFYCFNGIPKYLYVSTGMSDHATAKISFLKMDWSFAEFGRSDYKKLDKIPPKPMGFEKMIEIAKELSKDIPFLRVDLYEINHKVYFSELTFSPCAGFMPFDPKEWDEKLGDLLNLEKVK